MLGQTVDFVTKAIVVQQRDEGVVKEAIYQHLVHNQSASELGVLFLLLCSKTVRKFLWNAVKQASLQLQQTARLANNKCSQQQSSDWESSSQPASQPASHAMTKEERTKHNSP